ncbi:MAG: HD domain-containing protein [Lachnospiraceae bacterium]|nr:HD domain-containing protein [Lachnospiraceae bacterium]
MRYLKELYEGEMVSEVYLCKQVQNLKTKANKSYMSLTLQDKTGTFDGKIWELNNGIEHFEAMDYIKVDGQVTAFQGALQLNIRRVRRASEGEYDTADYMPCTDKDVEAMLSEIRGIARSVKEPHLAQLLAEFFENKPFLELFRKHSAAKSVHHAFIGGLLEHTLSVTQVCVFFAEHYPMLNRDLLVTAALFHDIGKLKELSNFPENDYTDEGNLLGHIYMGTEMIGRKIEAMPGFPKTLAAELKHCILAHHGELEFGSPKKPALAEALALSMADNLDAKMETLRELFRDNSDNAVNGWLGFQRLLDSNIRITEV